MPALGATPAVPHAQSTATGMQVVAQAQTYQIAVQDFRDRRYSAAYARFAQLADAGHAASAELALAMHRNGPMLFGTSWFASLDQQRRWNVLIINAARSRVPIDDRAGL